MAMIDNKIYKQIGRRIREERNRCGWTQEQLAEKIDVHMSFIGQLERGVNKPSLFTLKKIADALEIRAGDLFDETPPPAGHLPGKKLENLLRGYSGSQQEFLYNSFRIFARQFKKFPVK
jgi:transcriptional regulator with XRE-family HTH domain